MNAQTAAKASSPTRRGGRPKSLSLKLIVETAIAMGLADLSMKELAARLGVGMATLYRYVKNRDALISLALSNLAERLPPDDAHMTWQEVVRAYAELTFKTLAINPHLIPTYAEARWGSADEADSLEAFLVAMQSRGIDMESALKLYNAMGLVASSGAWIAVHSNALAERNETRVGELEALFLEEENDGAFPQLRQAVARFPDLVESYDWRILLEMIIAAHPLPGK
ncbi:putative TetR family transcriptional regulator [Caenibius tardaugens NBRC 16725]|uniref:Putative TetR family transcriptional regulator n=1 Tax=Caenibius tardaugens NBRC 16725 TaxID=1219035 RepID=U2ZXY5_9SPHN|nr:TetR family transcriptional regulator [Caenibius tardaugens]GAD50249.1 putative TetR family transcriptional regulator [Caenibius tardaugens NBRC 16725]